MTLSDRIEAALGIRPTRLSALAGGDIGSVQQVEFEYGHRLVIKTPVADGPDTAKAEATMLRHIAEQVADVPVPQVIHAEPALLILEHVEHDSGYTPHAGEHAGHIVAALHAVTRDKFGFETGIDIGAMPQPNDTGDSWVAFFRDQRLLHGARECQNAGRIDARLVGQVEALAERLDEFLPEPDAARLLHGDLWHGNLLVRGNRVAALIDPASYYGDPQVDLAMLTLFGDPGEQFFDAYREHHTLDREFFRVWRDILNLWPLLIHVRLFGGGYVEQIRQILNRLGVRE